MIALFLIIFGPLLIVGSGLGVLYFGFGETHEWSILPLFVICVASAVAWIVLFVLGLAGIIPVEWPLAWKG